MGDIQPTKMTLRRRVTSEEKEAQAVSNVIVNNSQDILNTKGGKLMLT